MNKTKHSMIRCKQRGIKESSIALIMFFGTKKRKPGGVYEYCIRKKDKQKVICSLKQYIQTIDKLEGTVIIADNNETVITAYHKTR